MIEPQIEPNHRPGVYQASFKPLSGFLSRQQHSPAKRNLQMAMNKETVEGAFDQAVGNVQSAVGDIAGDVGTQAEGKIRELKGKAEEAYGKAKDGYAKASEKAKEWAEHAPEAAREAREKAQRVAEEAAAKARQTVQEQPLAVLAGGIALGFVVGWLVSSGGRRRG
jgi:uncharacterized protein YjbJ (UPF0337 family)